MKFSVILTTLLITSVSFAFGQQEKSESSKKKPTARTHLNESIIEEVINLDNGGPLHPNSLDSFMIRRVTDKKNNVVCYITEYHAAISCVVLTKND